MFDAKLGFFENKHRHAEYDKKLKKLKDHVRPKRQFELVLGETQDIKLQTACPLQLKPTKLSDTLIESQLIEKSKKRQKHHRISKRKQKEEVKEINEDSILNGLQTVIDLCGLLEKFEKDNVPDNTFKKKIKIKEGGENFFQPAPPQIMMLATENVSKRESKPHETAHHSLKNEGQVHRVVSVEKPQELPRAVLSKVKFVEKPATSPAVVVINSSNPALRNRSQDDDIDKYWADKNASHRYSQTEYSVMDASVKTSMHSLTGDRPPSKETSTVGLVTEPVRKESLIRSTSTPSACDISEDNSRVSSKSKHQSSLKPTCFPPLEIVPCGKCSTARTPSCADITSSGGEDICICPILNKSLTRRLSPVSQPSRLSRSFHNPMGLSDISTSAKKIHDQLSRPGFPAIQPVLGYCRGTHKEGVVMKNIKYAIVKISEFDYFSTYEIMRPQNNKPRNMPTCISEIFVVSNEHNIISMGKTGSLSAKSLRKSYNQRDKSYSVKKRKKEPVSEQCVSNCMKPTSPISVLSRAMSRSKSLSKSCPGHIISHQPKVEKPDDQDLKQNLVVKCSDQDLKSPSLQCSKDFVFVTADPSMQSNIHEIDNEDVLVVSKDPTLLRSYYKSAHQDNVMSNGEPSLQRSYNQRKMTKNKYRSSCTKSKA